MDHSNNSGTYNSCNSIVHATDCALIRGLPYTEQGMLGILVGDISWV